MQDAFVFKFIRKGIALILFLPLIVSGCAQYKRPMLMIKVPDFYEHKSKLDLLTIVADPYFEASKNEYLFNSNLLDKGFLPVHFIAFNYGEVRYDLSAAHFVMIRDDGVELEPMNPAEISRKVLKHTSLRMIGWGFAGLVIFSIPFSIAAGIDSFRANKRIREAITKDTLRVFQIGPHEVVDGFYFFQMGRRSREIKEALGHKYQFRVSGLLDTVTAKKYELQIGLN